MRDHHVARADLKLAAEGKRNRAGAKATHINRIRDHPDRRKPEAADLSLQVVRRRDGDVDLAKVLEQPLGERGWIAAVEDAQRGGAREAQDARQRMGARQRNRMLGERLPPDEEDIRRLFSDGVGDQSLDLRPLEPAIVARRRRVGGDVEVGKPEAKDFESVVGARERIAGSEGVFGGRGDRRNPMPEAGQPLQKLKAGQRRSTLMWRQGADKEDSKRLACRCRHAVCSRAPADAQASANPSSGIGMLLRAACEVVRTPPPSAISARSERG